MLIVKLLQFFPKFKMFSQWKVWGRETVFLRKLLIEDVLSSIPQTRGLIWGGGRHKTEQTEGAIWERAEENHQHVTAPYTVAMRQVRGSATPDKQRSLVPKRKVKWIILYVSDSWEEIDISGRGFWMN